ncbi:SWIM zinc finger family protein [Romeria aff. gracilis LEGE 07310]|uniref:SWIM zinc finger family protein n=1 Tax=Vasconcelosia minhoensis LEGE 07310 TaxID=915328 RepID=A0A8J7AJB2_9CYAN|nr:SWIM zinc finger family protein [Romeria gracilis]MBE9078643.1 SWIM zinc finger family protein [Romeria aff. gracilis LEGE 07310]
MTYTSTPPTALDSEAWWVQQWVDLLNAYRFKKRLERGWKYAREGHILSLEFKGSKAQAQVQGTASDPYQLSIWIDSFSDEDWSYIIDTLADQALYSAQLLAGEMPTNIEEVFTANGLSLFPFTLADVHSRCSCPDPQNPCKHIAAVYYQLGDFFREDPFILFQLRGRTKEQILEALRQKRRVQADAIMDTPEVSAIEPAAHQAAEPSVDLTQFWQYETPLDSSLVVIAPAEQTVLEVLGNLPLPSSDAQVIMGHFTALYQAVAQQAMVTALS